MAGDAFDVDADLHASSLSAVDTAVRGLCGYDEFRADLVFVDDVLPAQAVAVFLLDGSHDHDLASFGDQVHILHDLCSVYCGHQAAALVGHAAPADLGLVLISFVWIKGPVVDIADAYGVNMRIVCDDPVACAHIADHIPLGIDDDLIEVQLFHLCGDRVDVCFFIAALARVPDNGAQECGHVRLITLRCFFDLVEIHSVLSPFLI